MQQECLALERGEDTGLGGQVHDCSSVTVYDVLIYYSTSGRYLSPYFGRRIHPSSALPYNPYSGPQRPQDALKRPYRDGAMERELGTAHDFVRDDFVGDDFVALLFYNSTCTALENLYSSIYADTNILPVTDTA